VNEFFLEKYDEARFDLEVAEDLFVIGENYQFLGLVREYREKISAARLHGDDFSDGLRPY